MHLPKERHGEGGGRDDLGEEEEEHGEGQQDGDGEGHLQWKGELHNIKLKIIQTMFRKCCTVYRPSPRSRRGGRRRERRGRRCPRRG